MWMSEAPEEDLSRLVTLLGSIMSVNKMAAVGLTVAKVHPVIGHASTQTTNDSSWDTRDENENNEHLSQNECSTACNTSNMDLQQEECVATPSHLVVGTPRTMRTTSTCGP